MDQKPETWIPPGINRGFFESIASQQLFSNITQIRLCCLKILIARPPRGHYLGVPVQKRCRQERWGQGAVGQGAQRSCQP